MKIKLMILGLVLMGLFCPVQAVGAAENTDYSIRPILPENQRVGASYYDLKLEPGQEQTIQVEVLNEGPQDATYEVTVNTAFTNDNVLIDYGGKGQPNKTLAHSVKDLVEYPKTVAVSANSSNQVDINLKMPEQAFAGVLLGGIRVKKVGQTEAKEESQMGIETSYTLGLVLSEAKPELEPDLKLQKVAAVSYNNYPAIAATLENPIAAMIRGVAITGAITPKGSDEVYLKADTKEHSIAPNTTFAYHFDTQEQPLKSGDYTMKLKLEDRDGREWDFTKDFTITKKQADRINKETLDIQPQDNLLLYIILGLLTALILLMLILLLRKRKNGGTGSD